MRAALIFLLFIMSMPPISVSAEIVYASGGRERQLIDRIVARVGSEPITQREIESLQAASPDLTYSTALQALIERRLILSWAESNRVTVSREELDRAEQAILENNNMSEARFEEILATRGQNRQLFRDDLMEQLIINKALRSALSPRITVQDEEIEQWYEENYPARMTFTIRHILLTPDVSGKEDDSAVLERANRIIEKIRSGASFESMAIQYSMDKTSAFKGGELGTFREGELVPELEKLALDLDSGELGGPVKTTMGYHILRLDGKRISEPPPLAEVREEIRATLASRKEVEVQTQWLKELRDSIFVEIFPNGEK